MLPLLLYALVVIIATLIGYQLAVLPAPQRLLVLAVLVVVALALALLAGPTALLPAALR